jgi:anti-sigma regulatory factor (Ser/Thr protein kinase)
VAQVALEIPARGAYVAVVRLAIAALARSALLDEDVADDLKMAVGEACANAVLSHETAATSAPVTVTWSDLGDRVVIEVGDRGVLYDPDAPADSLDSQGFSSRFVMSLALLRSLVDECRITRRTGGGMCTELVFRRPEPGENP